MIKKVVIPAAGSGTRLIPATKETPKEMLPIFSVGKNNKVLVKPLLQVIFEQLYNVGIREFCFIVGKGKGSITDHFATDRYFLKRLNDGGKHTLADELTSLYKMVNDSSLVFISQPEPRGFGDAVLKSKPYIKEPFLVQAGDTLILSEENNHLRRLLDVHEKYQSNATILVQEVKDPSSFGIIIGEEIKDGIYRVNQVEEKSKFPPTNLAITALYLFSPTIFQALESTSEGVAGEIQLTDGIQKMIDIGLKVMAVKLRTNEFWLDIGNPTLYWEALNKSRINSFEEIRRKY